MGRDNPPALRGRTYDTQKPNCIKQIVVMLWALQPLSAAVGVDCQEAKPCRGSVYPKQTLKKKHMFFI